MAYHTYNTPGLILDTQPSGESSQYVYVFTRDLGLVGAHAQNTRHVSSKLRYALDAPARSTVSLVRGKNMWRLISAVPEKSFYSLFRDNPEKQILTAQTFFLIKKLLAGEEPNIELFQMVNESLDFLENDINTTVPDHIKNFEAILLLRILHILGYIPETENLKKFYISTEWGMGMIESFTPFRKTAVGVVNESLRETGLIK